MRLTHSRRSDPIRYPKRIEFGNKTSKKIWSCQGRGRTREVETNKGIQPTPLAASRAGEVAAKSKQLNACTRWRRPALNRIPVGVIGNDDHISALQDNQPGFTRNRLRGATTISIAWYVKHDTRCLRQIPDAEHDIDDSLWSPDRIA